MVDITLCLINVPCVSTNNLRISQNPKEKIETRTKIE